VKKSQFNEYMRLARIYLKNRDDASYRKLHNYGYELQKENIVEFYQLLLIYALAEFSRNKKDISYAMLRDSYAILLGQFEEENDALSNTVDGTSEIGD
jgi:hypothetical protein